METHIDQKETFIDQSVRLIREKRSVLCVGLDPQIDKILAVQGIDPENWGGRIDFADESDLIAQHIEEFNAKVIRDVAPFAVWIKPNLAFYGQYGSCGMKAYELTVLRARRQGLLVIADGKRGDGGDTAVAYARTYLGQVAGWPNHDGGNALLSSRMQADALTVNPSIGQAWLDPLLAEMKLQGAGAFALGRTSFKPDSRFETQPTVRDLDKLMGAIHDLTSRPDISFHDIEELVAEHTRPMWQVVAEYIALRGQEVMGQSGWSNLGMVMGATKPHDVAIMRHLAPKSWFLVPGYGSQGGGADEAVLGADADGFGIAVNSSRGICYPPDMNIAAAAKQARDDLNAALKRAGKGRAFLL